MQREQGLWRTLGSKVGSQRLAAVVETHHTWGTDDGRRWRLLVEEEEEEEEAVEGLKKSAKLATFSLFVAVAFSEENLLLILKFTWLVVDNDDLQ